jgi:crotonobetainyl-CoA:carnitine CoA-transferase CaiB-like acyl-CoA transferase
LSDHDFGLRNNPPIPGERSDELLFLLGLDRNRIAALKKEGVIGPL